MMWYIKSVLGRCLRHLFAVPSIIHPYLSFSDFITFCKFTMCYYIWSMFICGSEQSLISSFTHIVYYNLCHIVMRQFACETWEVSSQAVIHSFWLCLITQWQYNYLRRRTKELIMFSIFLSRNTSVVKDFFFPGYDTFIFKHLDRLDQGWRICGPHSNCLRPLVTW